MMRTLLLGLSSLALLAACASTQEPTKAEAPKAEAPKPVAQCYSSDHGKFFKVGEKATISGVEVNCVATTDGKNGQWMGAKHGK